MTNKIITCFFLLIAVFSGSYDCYSQSKRKPGDKPNVVLILTDDQGIGDIGYLGNPFIKTPNLDRMAREGVILSNFYTSPVCSPSRASLLTGKYSIRTGVHDTYNGGSIMAAGEKTLAEYFRAMNFRTGIFGKWHLGDNYPFRAMDQGFGTSVVFKGGGIGQPGDIENYPRKDSSYFDPVLFHNDKRIRSSGYCSDVYTDAAISFVSENTTDPFFLFLSFNAPHVPLQVPVKYYDMYADLESRIKNSGNKDFLTDNIGLTNPEQTKRVYAMMSDIDDNVGRLLKALEDGNILDNTIIIFMSDNGPQQNRFKGGYRGIKGSVYEGGIRVPAFIYAPKLFSPKTVNETLAHIDILPTLLEIENKKEKSHDIDGQSFASLLRGETNARFDTRPLYFFWQRGFPEPYRNIAVRKGDFKLVGNTGASSDLSGFELYNLAADPGELENIGPQHPDIVNNLKNDFDNWHKEAIRSRSLLPASQRIIIGSPLEPRSTLNRNDAKGIPVVWEQDNVYFYWDVHIEESGYYDFDVSFLRPVNPNGKLYVRLAPYQRTENNPEELTANLSAEKLYIEKGDYILESWYQEATGQNVFPFYVEVQNSGYAAGSEIEQKD